MKCPYCNSDLFYNSYIYTGNNAAFEKGYANSGFKKIGDTWKCKNSDGFQNLDEAQEYKEVIGSEELIEEINCDSWVFNGNFWSDLNGEIHEGIQ